ncbi:MAG: flavodoxin family protein [Proteobacteria bacterium]|nr:flavodoxin family protein [Pseudomonadota bacterium]MBI3497881.1 flavodoxin family protein [Pseudomonadota bacterium]
MVQVAIAYHSGYGHTKVVAEEVAKGAGQVAGAKVNVIAVDKIDEADWSTLDAADAIIFGAPTYMGGPSGPFKVFADASSKRWMSLAWRDKLAAGFTNSASQNGDKLNSLQYFNILAMQHQMLWVGLDLPPGNNSSKGSPADLNRLGSWIGLMTQSNSDQPAELTPPEGDRKTAIHFGKRVAEAAARWINGKTEAGKAKAPAAEPVRA